MTGRTTPTSRGLRNFLRCALYAWVSTQDQNCELQICELREYCQRRGWNIPGSTWTPA